MLFLCTFTIITAPVSRDGSMSSDSGEATTNLENLTNQLQIDYLTNFSSSDDKPHQSVSEIEKQQKINMQKSTERMGELEKAYVEIQASNEYFKNQLSLTQQHLLYVQKSTIDLQNQLSINQQQLSDVQKANTLTRQELLDIQKTNTYLNDQLSLTQQQLSDVQKTNTLTQQELLDVQKNSTYLNDQLSLTQQQLSDVQKTNTSLKNQLSLTQQQLLGVQSMMTCSRVWVVSHDQFTIGREIGRGAWATVHETTFRGATVAAKCLHHLITSPRTRELFQREMEMALQCQHQNMVTFLGATLEGPPVILMELMDTSLRSAYEQGNIKDLQVLGILYDTASACTQDLIQ